MPVFLKKGEVAAVPPSDQVALVADDDGNVSAIQSDGSQAEIGGGVAVTDAAIAIERAQELLGPTLTKLYGSDFCGEELAFSSTVIVAAGTATQRTDVAGGVVTVATGALAAHGLAYHLPSAIVAVANPSTDKFYVRGRVKIATAVDSEATLNICLTLASGPGSASAVQWGACARATADTANFSFATFNAAGTETDQGSGDALDADYHVLEMYSDGTTVTFALDEVAQDTALASNLSTAAQTLGVIVYNGTTAVTRDIWIDSLFCVSEEAA